MGLSKYHLCIIGENFDVESFSKAYKGKDGRTKIGIAPHANSGIAGTGGVYNLWQADVVRCVDSVSDRYWLDAREWMGDEAQLIDYLKRVHGDMPALESYCRGPFSIILNIVYVSRPGNPIGGVFFSERLFALMGDLSIKMDLSFSGVDAEDA